MTAVLLCSITLLFAACSHKTMTANNQITGPAGNQDVIINKDTDSDNKKSLSDPNAFGLPNFSDIHFDYDQHSLNSESRAVLVALADYLKKNKNVHLLIEGHCDERGTNEYNFALGQRRASAAFQFLQDLGILPHRMKTISYGEERPLMAESTEEAWAKNRRAHFILTQNN